MGGLWRQREAEPVRFAGHVQKNVREDRDNLLRPSTPCLLQNSGR